jgi:hypothetical protein
VVVDVVVVVVVVVDIVVDAEEVVAGAVEVDAVGVVDVAAPVVADWVNGSPSPPPQAENVATSTNAETSRVARRAQGAAS